MGKAIMGAVEIAAAVGVFVVAPYLGPAALAFVTSTAGSTLIAGVGRMGVGQEIGALSDLFKAGPSVGLVTRQAAQPRRMIYGQVRIAPVIVFESTTGSAHRLNHILVWGVRPVYNIVSLYLDARQVHFAHDGYNGSDGTWGRGDGATYTSSAGNQYSFGSGVYAEHRFGLGQQTKRDLSGNIAPLWMTSLTGNDPKWTNTCTLNGIAYTYLKLDYDADMFPSGQPNVRATIQGREDIYDPRTGATGYSNNAALCIANYLTDADYGAGLKWEDLDETELIASANVCDEQVLLANGSYEPRYTINGSFTLDTPWRDALASMLEACAGRVSDAYGKVAIIVGYDRGATIAFDMDDMTGDVEWSSQRSARGKFNAVGGTFICPSYPYVPVGNLYNQDNREQGTFDGAYQPATYPPFVYSAERGYPVYPLTDCDGLPILNGDGQQEYGDAYLAEDNGEREFTDSKLQFVTSVAQCQRLGKIKLARHRQQGTGSIPLKLCGIKVTAGDNALITYQPFGWVEKEMLIATFRFVNKHDEEGVALLETAIDVQECDPVSEYDWHTSDELPLNDPGDVNNYDASQIASPTALQLESGQDSAVTTSDGIVHPRVKATWTAPADGMVVAQQIQYQVNGQGWWLNAASAPVAGGVVNPDGTVKMVAYVASIAQGDSVTVRLRTLRQNGVSSPWLYDGPHVVSQTNSVITTAALNPNSPVNVADTSLVDSIPEGGAATIRVYDRVGGDGAAWTLHQGSSTRLIPSAHITGLEFGTQYYVAYNVRTGQTVALTYALQTLSDDLYLITATAPMTTCSADYSPGGGGSGGGTPDPGTGSGGDPGGGGFRCFEEGTLIHTTEGVMSNVDFHRRWLAGDAIALVGRNGPEPVVRAEWRDVQGVCELRVAGESFRCSSTTRLFAKFLREHRRVTALREGDDVETLAGWRPLQRLRHGEQCTLRVLSLTMAGPSHEYLVGAQGLRTHNMKLQDDPVLNNTN